MPEGIPLAATTTRRDFVVWSAVAGASAFLGACGSGDGGGASTSGPAALPWLTWSDHYVPGQLKQIARATKVTAKPTLIGDNAPTYLKVKQTGGQFAVVAADAYWLPKYHEDGLTEPFPLDSIPVSKELYPVAREYAVWQVGSDTMGFPFGWSTKPLYFNPKYVTTKPDSWQAILSPKYRKKIVLEGDSGGVLAMAGLAVGAKEPFNMTDDELSDAKAFLQELKPNVLKLVSQASELWPAVANESAWIGLGSLGFDSKVKAISGLEIDYVIPKEGVFGFVDAEQSIKASNSLPAFKRWIDQLYQADWIAKNFLKYGRPLFNEKAYKLLVDQGHKEEADRMLYNQPELAFEQTLVGPAQNQQAVTDAYNEVFGS